MSPYKEDRVSKMLKIETGVIQKLKPFCTQRANVQLCRLRLQRLFAAFSLVAILEHEGGQLLFILGVAFPHCALSGGRSQEVLVLCFVCNGEAAKNSRTNSVAEFANESVDGVHGVAAARSR